MKKNLFVLVSFCFCTTVNAQHNADKSIDLLYEKFRASYQITDSAALSNLYWPDAVYIWSNLAIENGRPVFMKNFGEYFKQLKALGDDIDIIFQIEKRSYSADKTMCTDVGYYVFSRKGSKEQRVTGKMVNVFTKKNGEWRFLVDMSSEAPKEVFKGKGTILKNYIP